MTKILILSTIYGHKSIAEAIQETLREASYQTKTIIETNWITRLYSLVYQKRPEINGLAYHFLHQTDDNELLKTFTQQTCLLSTHQLEQTIQDYAPDLVINTYVQFIPVLEKLKQKQGLPFFNFVANPRTVIPKFELSPKAEHNLVFDQTLVEKIKPHGIETKPIGWFVRSKFEQDYQQDHQKKQLGLLQKPTFLINSGYSGKEKSVLVLKELLKKQLDLQLIFSCGKNDDLLKEVKTLSQNNDSQALRIIPLSFTDKLHQYLQAADLVIGKAGPNTIFESAATSTPFFATTHIPGQENGNLELIKQYQLGYVQQNAVKAAKKLAAISQDISRLDKFKPHLKSLAEYNQQAKPKLLKLVSQTI
jgi:UDP-N-acetylglucosamine:LPS N-acetylglucosamine transferase